jgi:N-acetylmuramoyl-L-alanine amidase
MRAIGLGLIFWAAAGFATLAQDLSGLARFVAEGSQITDRRGGVDVVLNLSQPVPWRLRLLADPPRLVLDMREADWTGVSALPRDSERIIDLRAGVFRPGWSRLVMELSGPLLVQRAEMETSAGAARIALRLAPGDPEEFAQRAALPDPPGWALPDPADLPQLAPRGSGPFRVVLDPGHGGLDPGAERDGVREADLMLTFAREFKEELLRQGGFSVVLTREEDVFVPLETRISIARAAQADLFLSLHADALAEGQASGATIYILSDEAVDRAAAALAERHDRDDLLAGIDLTEQDDLVARVLMDMARTETTPRVARLAESLKSSIQARGLRMHRQPLQSGGFSVLKSPDIPSALIELGFLSSPNDLAQLTDPEWRARMVQALREGIENWAAEEAALSGIRRP